MSSAHHYFVLCYLVTHCIALLTWEGLNRELDIVVASRNSSVRHKGRVLGDSDVERLWQLYAQLNAGLLTPTDQHKENFATNINNVVDNNCRYNEGKQKYRSGINRFSHMNHAAFNETMNGFKKSNLLHFSGVLYKAQGGVLKREIDWRTDKIVTPIRDQRTCGCCYAFSAAGVLESLYAKKTGDLHDLSEQQLIDCSYGQGNYGCNGGLMDTCYTVIRESGGIQSRADYPFIGRLAQCKFNPAKAYTSCGRTIKLTEGDEQLLMDAVQNVGPICVAIDASSEDLMNYRDGVYYDTKCNAEQLNHAVIVVGYGNEYVHGKLTPYWLIRNSWGESWGEKGYFKMARFADNMCGISSYCVFPEVSLIRNVPAASSAAFTFNLTRSPL